VKVGLLKEPVKEPVREDSWRLLRLEDGGGGSAECEPVGWVNVPVKDSVGLVSEPVGMLKLKLPVNEPDGGGG
jgi:hypothetical protein